MRSDIMCAELLVRPAINDHVVVEELLAPDSTRMLLPDKARAPIDRLILDAHIASRRTQFALAAASAGIPLLVDPLTHFWQTDLREDDRLAALPYGSSAAKAAKDFVDPLRRESLIASVLDFQLQHGATQLVAPYLYARTPREECFARSLELLEATQRRMQRTGVPLPLMAVLVGGHRGFASEASWSEGIDRFALKAREVGASAVALAFSPITPRDGYAKLLGTYAASIRVKQLAGVPTYAWRDGIFGAALAAAGLDGYETGIATAEACNIARSLAARRPAATGKKRSGGNAPGIYIDALGRSVSARVGKLLLESSLSARVICDDERCCPDGPASTTAHPREHAIRMRARQLQSQEALPHASWRLHQVAKDAASGATLALHANQVLEAADFSERIRHSGLEATVRLARHLLAEERAAPAA